MKAILCLLAVLAGSAQADTFTRLVQPSIASPYTHCVGNAFNADSSIVGVCTKTLSYPCSGRGCQPVRYVYDYIASWDAFGTPLAVEECSVTRRHIPQAPVTTYLNGHSAADCFDLVYNPTGTVVVIDGVPLWYVATDPVTGNALVNDNVGGYLYQP